MVYRCMLIWFLLMSVYVRFCCRVCCRHGWIVCRGALFMPKSQVKRSLSSRIA
ncbi:hypothetical protein EJB05_47249 [Eragrostis curvula]|uniref:Uncharacterized protein n=1 Tax=Eragrostis curvula TaxID=38414 RepID=A0A5J9T774_9POAL|nr:hypothetical protein EJB05_47249 [Eragrostis curvula]